MIFMKKIFFLIMIFFLKNMIFFEKAVKDAEEKEDFRDVTLACEDKQKETQTNFLNKDETRLGARGKSYDCNKCSEVFSFKNDLLKHIKIHISKQDFYECNQCKNCFSSEISLQAHKKVHEEQT